VVKRRQKKSRGFPGAGLCLSGNIPTFQGLGQRSGLNRRAGFKTGLAYAF
jgi:hypothetical protein